MVEKNLGLNITFPIYKEDGESFHDLVIYKPSYESVVMSLGDKITGDVYYKDNTLAFTMKEYIIYKDVKYTIVNPPTVVREGMMANNNGLNGLTKYSFEFYHPMYQLSNLPFTDIAVSKDEERYLSQNKAFNWIGKPQDYIDKLNKNLEGTIWLVTQSNSFSSKKNDELSEVLSFDNNTIADALKTAYETWEEPFTITKISEEDKEYGLGKRFKIEFGTPSKEIYASDDDRENETPFVFKFGQGVGLKNNSRTPKKNKIVTRLSGYGSESNIPYGYPQIEFTGQNNPNGYPLYNGIMGGRNVQLIKHPFTRNHLMPSIYVETVRKKVCSTIPNVEIIDYYDADETYPNPIVPNAPSYEIHEFEKIKPELGEAAILSAGPFDNERKDYSKLSPENFVDVTISYSAFAELIKHLYTFINEEVYTLLTNLQTKLTEMSEDGTDFASDSKNGGAYNYNWTIKKVGNRLFEVRYTDSYGISIHHIVYMGAIGDEEDEDSQPKETQWIDTMDDDGNYDQSYLTITLPTLSFDIYACASITEEMTINMRSGACIGCSFAIQVDWDDYKKNFYEVKEDGTQVFSPNGKQRDYDKYPDSSKGSIKVIAQKDNETFGTLMPNVYQQPAAGDKFVILGISLPLTYITEAEQRLDEAMKEYLLENNYYYYEYPLKFDEYFLANHTDILGQIENNKIVRFQYGNENNALYVKQISIKYGNKALPEYNITLTDDVEIVLNKIGQVTEDVSKASVQLNELQKYYGAGGINEAVKDEIEELHNALDSKLSRVDDDAAQGKITFRQGIATNGSSTFGEEVRSTEYEGGLYTGRGWRIDRLGNAEVESLRVRSFLETVELLINRVQAQEGDTLFTDNDQVERVRETVDEANGSVSYVLTLKEKWEGYVTAQQYGNILKGIINTLAANQAGVSDERERSVESDGGSNTATDGTAGGNLYYTSWMRVTGTAATDGDLGLNQIRVVLYGDSEVPAGRNFAPCELMTIARWGCVDYAVEGSEGYEAEKASIERRQRVFMISASDGRIVKFNGVDSPMLKNGHYAVTIGELPEFVKRYPKVRDVLMGYTDPQRGYIEGVGEHSDWLYAQGVVVGNYIKIDREGLPVAAVVDCGEWEDGRAYLYNGWNAETLQYETHRVHHLGATWQCLESQPVVRGGVETYYEPQWGSPYWRLAEGGGSFSLEFTSSRGYSFRRGFVDTEIKPYLYAGNVDISDYIAAEYWSWTRASDSGKTAADEAWDERHKGQRALRLTDYEMPQGWSRTDRAVFTCRAVVQDGKADVVVENQVVA